MAELASAVFGALTGATATTGTALTASQTAAAVAAGGAEAATWAAGTTVSAAGSSLVTAAGSSLSTALSFVQGAVTLGSMVSTLLAGQAASAEYNTEAAMVLMAGSANAQNARQSADLAEISASSQRLGAKQAEIQATNYELAAREAEIKARQAAIAIKRDLAEKIGSARVAFAASGLDISSGAEIETELGRQGDYQLGTSKRSGEISAAGARASQYASLAEAAGRRAQADSTEGKAKQLRNDADYQESMANLKASGLKSKGSWSIASSSIKAATQAASFAIDLKRRG